MTDTAVELADNNVDPLDPSDELEVEENVADDENFYPVEYSISSYGADYPMDGLVKRINAESIYVPRFQRGYVWNFYRASRFIESLLLALPVPAIFRNPSRPGVKNWSSRRSRFRRHHGHVAAAAHHRRAIGCVAA